ncbi:PREDICTED: uncharacterized protein LOC104811158 [Tarenaya hassleriana]|uniref:uncharacterized protein LOC104811158 n=1 Tax=Tarenaya hassleriana TaxID=28532 RepID=UPI00053C53BE|nr:PREDICTED: uncharacterized protein LOC104811158 [Tarenaya hassleriana]
MPKLASRQGTSIFVWCAAIICALISVAVIFGGIAVFVGYLVIHPRIPIISVVNAHLDLLRYDISRVMETQITIIVRAENDNEKAHATFEDTEFHLSFGGKYIAILKAAPFKVGKNSSLDFSYVVQSYPVPLGPTEMQMIDYALKQDVITFDLKGDSRTRWRVGPFGSVRFWCDLNCELNFRPSDHSYLRSPCSSSHKH